MQRFLAALDRFFAGFGFAAWTIGLIFTYQVWLVFMLAMPAGDGPLAAFAAEFRAWCFGADTVTGASNVVQSAAMLTSPLLIVAVVAYVWGGALRDAVREARPRLLAHTAASVLVAGGLAALLMVTAELPVSGPLPFPAVALRTAVPAPPIQLIDHTGQPFAMAGERGRVVLLTAVYSTCGYTCPGLLADLEAARAALTPEQRAELRVVIPTLDPVRDTRSVLAEVADKRGFVAPGVRMLTGQPDAVEAALDRLGFERRRNPETGVIDHANLFLLIDRQGRIAYRLAPGEAQRPWLVAALRVLLEERAGS